MSCRTYSERLEHITKFYSLMSKLEECIGGKRELATCEAIRSPRFGVYFFFEPGEDRQGSGEGLRIVRVGTHALRIEIKKSLWSRLCSHRGTLEGKNPGGGNHRGSVFRLHIGKALIKKEHLSGPGVETWSVGNHAPAHVRKNEEGIERLVSQYIRCMPFVYLPVQDFPEAYQVRGDIEKNSIALLSNYFYPDNLIDPPSRNWLGCYSPNMKISQSGLWNVNHVNECCDPGFLVRLSTLIGKQCDDYKSKISERS
jgi:hypothetical protein